MSRETLDTPIRVRTDPNLDLAPEIDINNKGRAMLMKMGWTSGTGLGAVDNKGILHPVAPVIKTTKSGLR